MPHFYRIGQEPAPNYDLESDPGDPYILYVPEAPKAPTPAPVADTKES